MTPADRLLPEEALQSSGRPVPAAPYVFDQSPENMPVPTGQGVHEGRAVDPDEVLYDEGFVNGTVVSPQGRNDSRPRISGGNTVDLMALPEAQRGLPEGVGIIRMGSESTGRGPIAPPTDFSTPVEQPAAPERLGLPVQPLTGVNPGLWSGGKSQLAYGQPSSPVVNMPSTAPGTGRGGRFVHVRRAACRGRSHAGPARGYDGAGQTGRDACSQNPFLRAPHYHG